MEELFRFSVVRAASKATDSGVSIERPSPDSQTQYRTFIAAYQGAAASGGGSFTDQLRNQVQLMSKDNIPAEQIWAALEPIALQYMMQTGAGILSSTNWVDTNAFLNALKDLTAAQITPSQWPISKWTTDGKTNVVQLAKAFTTGDKKIIGDLTTFAYDLGDVFVALLILRRSGPAHIFEIVRIQQPPIWDMLELLQDKPSLQNIGEVVNLISLMQTGPTALAAPPEAKTPADIQAAVLAAFQKCINKTLLLPKGLFAPLQKPIHGVGFRELHVVKQHIRGYEMGEIAKIENILKGEAREHKTKHTLSNERDTFIQTDTTTETDKELTSTDHVDIKNETDNQVKEDTKVDAGVHAQYDGGSFKIQADLTVSYDKSSDDTKKYSSDVAKDVTQKASSKVTQQVTQSQTTKIIETFEESEGQSFDNKGGQAHVSGVYQWVEKVYLAQVFNLGRHMLLDIMVPEPGSNLLQLATSTPPNEPIPVPPYPLGSIKKNADGTNALADDGNLQLDQPLNPIDLSPTTGDNFYGTWVARYEATSVDPPPVTGTTFSKAIVLEPQDDSSRQVSDNLHIDDGFEATKVIISFDGKCNDNPPDGAEVGVTVTVGSKILKFPWPTSQGQLWSSTGSQSLSQETGSISYGIWAPNITQLTLTIEIFCSPTSSVLEGWKLKTYEKIATAWQKLQSDYVTAKQSQTFGQATVGPLGAADPEQNRLTERVELKRACIAIIDNSNDTVGGRTPAVKEVPKDKILDPKTDGYPQLPEIDLPMSQIMGTRVRWFEQAFEWENLAYVFYPYYWGRRSQWVQNLGLKNDDPMFLNFLQAGYARVLVPVRLGFEKAVCFYLHTGCPWLGGGLPSLGDKSQNPLYLDIAEEIKALTGGGTDSEQLEAIGDPWEIKLPTTLLKLRKDDLVPSWSRFGPNPSTTPPPKIGADPNFPSDPPIGPWTWGEDDKPKLIPYTTS